MQADGTPPVLAVFDFDGTLSDRHTFWRYMRYVAGTKMFWLKMIWLLPKVFSVILGVTPLMQARLAFIARYLGGVSVEQEREHARHFVTEQLPRWIRPEALRRLQWHQSMGHVTALVSNSPENYLAPWGGGSGVRLCVRHSPGNRERQADGGASQAPTVLGRRKSYGSEAAWPTLMTTTFTPTATHPATMPCSVLPTPPFYRNWY